jgi:hypothetical protein
MPLGRAAARVVAWFRGTLDAGHCGCRLAVSLQPTSTRRARLELLEDRRLLAVFPFPAGVSEATLRFNPANNEVELVDDAGAILEHAPLAALGDLTVQGKHHADETLTVDLAGGLPVPAGGLTFHGGDGGFDTLAVSGDGSGSAVYVPDAHTFGNGVIEIDADGDARPEGVITFTGLEPMDMGNMMNAGLATQGADDVLMIENGSSFTPPPHAAIVVSGTTRIGPNDLPIETVAFFNNTNVTIDTTVNDGFDEINFGDTTIGMMGPNVINLSVQTGGDGAVIDGTVTVLAGASLTVSTSPENPLVVSDNGTLQGGGTVNADVNNSNGLIDPLGSMGPGTLTIIGNYSMCGDCGAAISLLIRGSSPSSNNDLLRFDGPGRVVDLGSDANLILVDEFQSPPSPGDSITLVELVDSSSSLAPDSMFSGYPEGGIVPLGGANFVITYSGGDGNDIVLTLGGMNPPPTAEAGGPYDMFERESLALDASGSFDPNQDIVEYAWDLDNDGQFDDHVSTGPVTTVPWSVLDGLNLPVETQIPIQLRVTDQANQSDMDGTTLVIVISEPDPIIDEVSPGTDVGCDVAQTFDGTISGHTNENRDIVLYEWDFDYDGVTFVPDATGPVVMHTYLEFGSHTTALRVTDDDPIEPQSRITTVVTSVNFNNLPPVADAGGPYTATIAGGAPQPITLDGTASSDPNAPCDSIVRYEWDMDFDGLFGPDDVNGVGGNANLAEPVGPTPQFADPAWQPGEVRQIALRVTDTFGVQHTDNSTVSIVLGQAPPVADADGPYIIDAGQGVTLDGSGSSDPNECCGDSIVQYAWDLNNNGIFGESQGGQTEPVTPDPVVMVSSATLSAFNLTQTGTPFTIRLRVTDSGGLSGQDTTTLTIFNNQPIAVIETFPDPPEVMVGEEIFFDGSQSTHGHPDHQITAYFWDFDASDGVNLDPNAPGFSPDAMGQTVPTSFPSAGSFTVTLLVLDDNMPQRTDTQTVVVTVAGPRPVLDAGGPYAVAEGGSVTLHGACIPATSPECASATFGWDFNGDGADDASGLVVNFSAANLDGPGMRTAVLTGRDALGNPIPGFQDSATIDIQNVAPTITSTPATSGVVEQPYAYQATATDPAGPLDPLAWSLVASPAGMTVHPTSGLVQWMPLAAGNHNVTLRVNDGDGGTQDQSWTIRVIPGASAGGPYSVNEGSSVTLQGSCDGCTQFSWDLDDNGSFETPGAAPVFSAAALDGPSQHTVHLRACDASGNFCGESSAVVTVNNVAPTITSTPPTTGVLNQEYVYQAAATDPAGPRDPITWNLVSGPQGMTVNAATGRVTWTPSAAGTVGVTLRASDGDGGQATQSWNITVPGAVSAGGPYTVDEGGSVQLTATCPTCTSFRWDLDANGTFETTGPMPVFSAATIDGPAERTVRLEGCVGGACSESTAQVTIRNVAPTITSSPTTTGMVGQVYMYDAAATDPAGPRDPLTFSLVSAPAGMTVNATTGLIQWTPSAPGNAAVTLRVADGDGGTAQQSWNIAVTAQGTFVQDAYFFYNNSAFDRERAELVTVAGAAAGGHVKVFDGSRAGAPSELASFLAYPGFAGGVTVAAGDVNGDGRSDVIAAAGPGAASGAVKVFDGGDGRLLRTFFAFPAQVVGVTVAAGDVNGDGFADIITGAGPGAPGGHVKVFSGRDHSELWNYFFFDTYQGGVRVGAGDVNGDGRDDIIVGAGAGAPGGHVKVFDGVTSNLLANFFAFPQFTGGVFVAGGDVNGDGFDDIITGAGPGAGPHVKVFSGRTSAELASFFAYDASFSGGVRVASGDVNGDGRADIITAAGPGAGPHVKVFSGQSLAELRSFFAYGPTFTGGVFVAAGDFSGDGASADDLLAIDPNKEALRPGQKATVNNVSSYKRGINGLGFDILNLPNGGAGITAADFEFRVGNDNMPDAWPIGPLPESVAVVDGDAPGEAVSVLMTFDDKAIMDTWLRVRLKANANTGLATAQDYFFGNVVGETGAAFTGQGQFFGRDSADFNAIIASGLNRPASVGDPQDINGDARVNIFDIQAIAVAGIKTNVLLAITPQSGQPPVAANVAPAVPLPLGEKSSAAASAKDRFFAAAGRDGLGPVRAEPFVPLIDLARSKRVAPAMVATTSEPASGESGWSPTLRDLALEEASFADLDFQSVRR